MAFENADTSWFNDTSAYCPKCDEWLPLGDFYTRADNHPAPVWATCKKCWRTVRNRTQRARREMQRKLEHTVRYCSNGHSCVHAEQIRGPVKLRRRWEMDICEQCHRRNVRKNIEKGVVTSRMVEDALSG